jgi:hypothetical protein
MGIRGLVVTACCSWDYTASIRQEKRAGQSHTVSSWRPWPTLCRLPEACGLSLWNTSPYGIWERHRSHPRRPPWEGHITCWPAAGSGHGQPGKDALGEGMQADHHMRHRASVVGAPHHPISDVGRIGGGQIPRPGRGVAGAPWRALPGRTPGVPAARPRSAPPAARGGSHIHTISRTS